MARGKRTDPAHAALVKVMAEMGFEPGTIAEITRLPRATVKDIIRGHGPWRELPDNELTKRTRERVRGAIESAAENLAMKVVARLKEKIKNASFMESLRILEALMGIGG
jgi:hypothetical protein